MNNPEILPDLQEIWQTTLGWQPNSWQLQQFQRLYEEILVGNRHLNLTRIVEAREFWEKHLWDSLAGLHRSTLTDTLTERSCLKAIDIGTGAGFPGIPIAIAYPHWQMTLLDSTAKKINFIDRLLKALKIENATTLTARVEEIGRNSVYRETYDLGFIRAVGEPSVCAEYALPLLKINGMAILYRGHWDNESNIPLQAAVERLGATIESVIELKTPLTQSLRHCIYLRKTASTPLQFPRSVGVPTQKPL